MEILQLRYFCSAAETENFSATAKSFKVPPSDISQSIKRLERELGISLFNRGANRIKLNEKGREFYQRINNALQIIDSAVKEASGGPGVEGIKICIKTNRRIAMQAVEKFRMECPDIDIIVRHSGVRDDEFDFIIADEEDSPEGGFEATEILSEQALLAMKAEHPLAKESNIDLQKLKDESFVSMNSGTSMYSLTCRACEEMGFHPHVAIQSDDPFYIRRCVELGLAMAVVPSLSWRGQFSDEVVLKPVTHIKRVTRLCRNRKMPFSKSSERFAAMIIEEFKKEKQ